MTLNLATLLLVLAVVFLLLNVLWTLPLWFSVATVICWALVKK